MLPIPAFLVEHPTAGPILVDTGLHAQVAATRRRARPGGEEGFSIDMRPDQAVPAQLRARGVDPEDVGVIVMTHLHYDHASGRRPVPRRDFVVDRREWEAVAQGG